MLTTYTSKPSSLSDHCCLEPTNRVNLVHFLRFVHASSIIRIKPMLTLGTAKENRTPLVRTSQLCLTKIHLRVAARRALLTGQGPMIDLFLSRYDLNRRLEPLLQ